MNKICRSCSQSIPEGMSTCPHCGVFEERIDISSLFSLALLCTGIFIRPHIVSSFWHIIFIVLRWYIAVAGGIFFLFSLSVLIERFKIPNLRTKIKCSLLSHKISHWEFASSHSCKQIRSCERGDYEQERTASHQYDDWEYIDDNTCQQIRICRRDGFQEGRAKHRFGEWKYVKDNACEQIRICSLDGFQEEQTSHQWGKGYSDEDREFVTHHIRHQDDVLLLSEEEYEGIDGALYEVWIQKCERCGKFDKHRVN